MKGGVGEDVWSNSMEPKTRLPAARSGLMGVVCRFELEILSGTGCSRSTDRVWPQGIALCPYRPPVHQENLEKT